LEHHDTPVRSHEQNDILLQPLEIEWPVSAKVSPIHATGWVAFEGAFQPVFAVFGLALRLISVLKNT